MGCWGGEVRETEVEGGGQGGARRALGDVAPGAGALGVVFGGEGGRMFNMREDAVYWECICSMR